MHRQTPVSHATGAREEVSQYQASQTSLGDSHDADRMKTRIRSLLRICSRHHLRPRSRSAARLAESLRELLLPPFDLLAHDVK